MENDSDEVIHAELDNDFMEAVSNIAGQRPWGALTDIEKDEQSGVLSYEFVTNDGADSSLVRLVHCKCLFARQLPKMPKEYIVRLVFDRRHMCLVMKKKVVVDTGLKTLSSPPDLVSPTGRSSSGATLTPTSSSNSLQKEVVVGAVCFRLFGKFAEIAFLAVSSKEQVRGYGSRLMNHLKELLKVQGVTDLVTYADNSAVGYFAKQGFYSPIPSVQSTKPDSEWHTCVKTGYEGFIKDYDGANKMVCCIYKDVNYLTLSQMRIECTAAVWQAIVNKNKPVRYKGLEVFPDRIYAVPGLEFLAPPPLEEPVHAGSAHSPRNSTRGNSRMNKPPVSVTNSPQPPRQRPVPSRLQVPTAIDSMVNDVLETSLSNGSSWPFKDPVDVNLAPDYYQVIQTPMDISTMKQKNERGQYTSLEDLRADFKLMFDNCLFYNGDESIYAHAAKVLEKAVFNRIDRLEQMAGSR